MQNTKIFIILCNMNFQLLSESLGGVAGLLEDLFESRVHLVFYFYMN
ncbi:hypothetical protein pb186bvf_013558 [Paramecium bursaria]